MGKRRKNNKPGLVSKVSKPDNSSREETHSEISGNTENVSCSNRSSPNLLPLPENDNDLLDEAKLLQMLPIDKIMMSNIELSHRQQLISALYRTKMMKRNRKQCTIVLVGNSGSGKSSTINYLFDLQGEKTIRADENDSTSQTRSAQEYILRANYPKYQLKDAILSVIDTPGFNDTSGLPQDACNLLSMRNFFNDYKTIKPNLILLCINAADNRCDRENFFRSLRCLKSLKIIDTDNPNVIAVLTHPCSVHPLLISKPGEWRQELETIMNRYCERIETALGQRIPFVMIENGNKYLNQPSNSSYTELPGGELQPRNLFWKCSEIFSSNNDKFGQIIFDACFMDSNQVTISKGVSTAAKIVKDEKKLSPEEKKLFKKLKEEDDFLFSSDSYQNSTQLSLLLHGYDLINDRDTDPIVDLTYVNTSLNMRLPTVSSHYKKDETIDTMEMCSSVEEYREKRIAELGVPINYSLLKFNMKAGWNLIKSDKESHQNYSFHHELCLYTVRVHNYPALKVTDVFRRAVDNLSDDFDANEGDSFKRFFDKWGQYVVTSVNIGGSATGNVTTSGKEKSDFNSIKSSLLCQMQVVNAKYSANVEIQDENLSTKNCSFSDFRFKGGNTDLHVNNTFESNDELLKWHKSIKDNPVVLNSGLRLEPIYSFVEIVNKQKGKACHKAFRHYYQSAHQPEENDLTREETVAKAEKGLFDSKSCFPLDSFTFILKEDGTWQLSQLSSIQLGDQVMTWSKTKKSIKFSPIIGFADYYSEKSTEFLEIILNSGHRIFITGNHLLLLNGQGGRSILAKNIQVGDELVVHNSTGIKPNCQLSQVRSIKTVVKNGCLAPITMEGNLFVDGVLASCYASAKDRYLFNKFFICGHEIAHFAMFPLRIKYLTMGEKQKKVMKMDPYIQWLTKRKWLLQKFSTYLS